MSDQPPRRFVLRRLADHTGVSGTGDVAEGIEFSDGTAAMRWRTGTASTAIYASIADVEAIHGHGGQTVIAWWDPADCPMFLGEADDLRRFKREHHGITCRAGHHTRFADLIGDPNDEDWRCSHCVRHALDGGEVQR